MSQGVLKTQTKLSRKERERLSHRHLILSTAEKLFSTKGYYGTTISDIASAAEFAVGTIYQHFSSKDELYNSVLEEKVEDFIEGAERAVAQAKSPLEKIENIINFHLSYAVQNESFIRIYLIEKEAKFNSAHARMWKDFTDGYIRYLEIVSEVIRGGINNGIFKKVDPLRAALALTGIVLNFISYWLSGEGDAKGLPNEKEFILNMFLNGIERGNLKKKERHLRVDET